jgi:hypothetical protein
LRAERAGISSEGGESGARKRAAYGSPGQKRRGLEPIGPSPSFSLLLFFSVV